MKVTLNWLKQYVDFDWSPEQLSERLTMLGLEVEGVHKVAGEFEGIVVAQILTKDKVQGSDKLSVCKVNDGKGERTIICGAPNHKPGDKVPLILPNFALPLKPGEKEPFVIKERKVFGTTSQGMMCSPQELGLPDQVDGLLILPDDAPVGRSFAEYLGRTGGDVVYDLEITPNRPDWNSVIGIAREIAALTGNPLKVPGIRDQVSGGKVQDLVAVRIEDAELCPRYTARVIKGVKIGPSPDWLRSTLEKVGIRSISNVVDVTNFVMLEIGQPLHAFDYHLIGKGANGQPTIVIRRARDDEKFKTLDNVERTLDGNMLLIADEQKGIALAGIMGGQNTEINDQTKDVLIESAYFNPTNIRRTSNALGLRSESSYRFERGADVGICDWASQRAVQLILETAGVQLAEGVVDVYPNPAAPKQVVLRHQKVGELLGVSIPPVEQVRFLKNLGLRAVTPAGAAHVPLVAANLDTTTLLNKEVVTGSTGTTATFEIPTFRVDIKREVDLIEEIARLYGVEKIPATPPRGAIGSNAFDAVHDQIADARGILSGLGLNEAQGQTLVANAECRLENIELAALANPLSSDMDVLRPSLLPGLIHSLRHNVSRKNYDVALFEVGRVFQRVAGGTFKEERRIAIALTGQRNPLFWSGEEREAKFDVYDLKGLIEEFFDQFGLRGMTYNRRAESTALFLESATIQLGKQQLGEFGQLLPPLAKKYDLRDAVFLAELNLDLLLARRNPSKSFKALPAFPSIRRDVAMIVPEATTHEAVLQVVKQTKPANLEAVELFDVFRGKNVPDGQKSLAYAFTYRNAERTLTDAEATAAHEKLVEQFKNVLQAAVRE
ncbi:MAG TPA: phenylalanine--tRNA ligase subunit beta [Verrucomicrobiae bacterium]|jgi:phenylalanyl-tRNA synthetase beta chain|nr:phenylalanine--tRNA ligase subunit beta [Verrucomicrobiae bacterium]